MNSSDLKKRKQNLIMRRTHWEIMNQVIAEHKCQSIMEIGVCRGDAALSMISAALKIHNKIYYYGFDLFDDLIDDNTMIIENFKRPFSLDVIKRKLNRQHVTIELIEGNTKDTLPQFLTRNIPIDFVYIDGGHAYETIRRDWHYIQKIMNKNTVVVFDDYIESYPEFGPTKVINDI